jgi:CBS domain-containing protein
MDNIVNQKIKYFLRDNFLFDKLDHEDLDTITNQVTVKYLNKNEILFKSKENLNSNFFVVQSGNIGLYAKSNSNELLVDQCYAGISLGLRPHFAQNVYQLTSKALEDSLILEIPFNVYYEIAIKNVETLNFLLKSFSSNKRNPNNLINPGFLVSQNVLNSIHNNTFDYFQQIKYKQNILVASPLSRVGEIIEKMQLNNMSCVFIEENEKPIGIITDVNIRNNYQKLIKNIEIKANEIMTTPVITASEDISLPEAQLIFVEHSIQYICITKNGSVNSKTIGLVSINDVIAAAVDNPNLILQQIKASKNIVELKEIRVKINQFISNTSSLKIPIAHTSKIIGEFNEALIKKVIDITLSQEATPPPTLFAWFSMGSIARHEQILLTDQNNGLIFLYENEQDRNYTEIRNYFINFSDKVVNHLKLIGYEYSEEGFMANKLKCCKSLIEWNKMYQDWIFNTINVKDEINPIFFDTQFIHGDINIYNQLLFKTEIEIGKQDVFLSFLGKKSLKYPAPLGFFKQFILEDEQENKNEFDIKNRAIQPIIDASRVLLLRYNETSITNTFERLSKLIQLDLKNKLLYEDCIESFIIFQEFRTKEGLNENNNGNYINIELLSKQDQNKLKQSFESISNIQELIKDMFNFNYFN